MIIMSPQYTRGDFMFLYRFVRRRRRRRHRRLHRRRRRPQTCVHAKTSEKLFGFVLFFGRINDLEDCLIRFWSIFVMTLT